MNKLVSKNPVQRFKEGKKIVKAQWGLKTREDGVIVNRAGIPVGKSIMGSSYEYEKYFPEDKLILPGLYQDKDTKNIFSTNSTDSNGNYNQVISGPSPIQNGTYYETKDASGKIIDRGRYFGGKKHSLPIGTNKSKTSTSKGNKSNSVQQRNPRKSTSLNQQKGSNNSFKLAFDTARNSGEQEFTWNGKKYNTMKKGETKEQWLNGLKGQQQIPQLNQVTPIISIPMFTASKLDQQPVITNTPKPTYNFNRSQTRQLMRNAGYNPYDFTGVQRKALRLYLNGQSNDISQLEGIDLDKFKFKNGGILPSRNILIRFKTRNLK